MKSRHDTVTQDIFSIPGWGDVPVAPRRPAADPPRARHTDPATSHEAAAHANFQKHDDAILACLRNGPPGGLTSYEIADLTGISLVCVSPRMRPLCRVDVLVENGRRDRRTVWTLVRRG